MRTDYRTSAGRHWSDAEFLRGDRTGPNLGRLPNADQLYGFAAECALKAVLVGLNARTRPDGSLDEQGKRVHIDRLWREYHATISGRPARRLHVAWDGRDNPFADWSTDLRYAADENLPPEESVNRHRRAARACLGILERAGSPGRRR